MRGKRSESKQVAVRMLHMILAVPTDGWVKTRDVVAYLEAAGFAVSTSSVRKDLKACAAEFGLQHRRIGFGEDYSWTRTRRLE